MVVSDTLRPSAALFRKVQPLEGSQVGYEEGRILASAGRYAAAIPLLQRALKALQSLQDQNPGSDDALPFEIGSSYIWLGEAEAGEGNLEAALDNYRKASAAIQPPSGERVADDTLCGLATSYIKTGDVLARMGGFEKAAALYEKALEIAVPLLKPENQDVPAMYAAADAYAGLGKVSEAGARRASDGRERTRLWSEALSWYEKSLKTWQNIPNPSSIGPVGFKAGDPAEIARRMADCKRATR
jgi:tetratricopeptide (TPR) repeat protein